MAAAKAAPFSSFTVPEIFLLSWAKETMLPAPKKRTSSNLNDNSLIVDCLEVKNWFNFGYDQSTLQQKKYYLLNATFKLKKAQEPFAVPFARGRRQEIIRHRTNRYPSMHTCGSFFRNFHEDEVSLTINGKKIIYVAYYLDRIGVKGTSSVGGAHVSHQHANMFVTKQGATSTDIIELARSLQKKIFDQFGIIPQPECQLIGFHQWPLL